MNIFERVQVNMMIKKYEREAKKQEKKQSSNSVKESILSATEKVVDTFHEMEKNQNQSSTYTDEEVQQVLKENQIKEEVMKEKENPSPDRLTRDELEQLIDSLESEKELLEKEKNKLENNCADLKEQLSEAKDNQKNTQEKLQRKNQKLSDELLKSKLVIRRINPEFYLEKRLKASVQVTKLSTDLAEKVELKGKARFSGVKQLKEYLNDVLKLELSNNDFNYLLEDKTVIRKKSPDMMIQVDLFKDNVTCAIHEVWFTSSTELKTKQKVIIIRYDVTDGQYKEIKIK